MRLKALIMYAAFALVWPKFKVFGQPNSVDDRETRQIELWKGKLREAETLTEIGKLESLQLGLINMAHRQKILARSPEIDTLYSDIQATLLGIPDHAQHFADEIERERELIKDAPPRSHLRGTYNHKRAVYLSNLLPLLPSPETIKVLGRYLDDERDPMPPAAPAQDWSDLDSNAKIASGALMAVGLRNPPAEKSTWGDPFGDTALAKQRAWFAKVMAGEIAFSFKGQRVEYRFKPDGTWDTLAMINPPDDGPKVKEQAGEPRESKKVRAMESPAQVGRAADLRWVWVVVGLVVAVLSGFWVRRRAV